VGNQQTFAGLAWKSKKKVTGRERFLTEMEALIPWKRLMALIEPFYPKSGKGRQPLGLEKMLRIYLLQLWFELSDPQAEDTIYDSESMRRFVGVDLTDDTIPDETTILRFRHLIEEHGLGEAIFHEINTLLVEKRLLLSAGTIVDATIIAAPSSTKNSTKSRDPEMKQTKKGGTWHFGMKIHAAPISTVWCTASPPRMLQRPTSSSCRTYCTGRNGRSSAIRRIGKKLTTNSSARRACGTGSTAEVTTSSR
jgi:transposase